VLFAPLKRRNNLLLLSIDVSKTASSIEAIIIAAGFKESELIDGREVIGDGDSSVFHAVQITIPYGRDV